MDVVIAIESVIFHIDSDIIAVTSTERDQHEAADLTFTIDGFVRDTAVRIRDYQYIERGYGDQFTIRYDRLSGTETEFSKIMKGHGHYFFYGFKTPDGKGLAKWFIGNLNKFRECMNNLIEKHGEQWLKEKLDSKMLRNYDSNHSGFIPFFQDKIPGFVMVSSETFSKFLPR